MNQPNIVVIMADQLAPQFTGAYGHPVAKTPHIDALANKGMRFDAAYCNSPLCAPSRFSFMSGQLISRIAAYDNASEFKATIPTFAHYLRMLGYRTCLSGKMHFVGPDQKHGFEDRVTTDIYPSDFAWTPDWEAHDERIDKWYHNMQTVKESGVAQATFQIDYDDEVGFAARRWLFDMARSKSQGDNAPFALVASFIHPHDPYVARPEWWEVTGGRGGIGRAVVKRLMKEGAMVYAADLTQNGSLATHNDDGSQYVKLDVTAEQDSIDAFKLINDQHGKLDVLVNAAGIEIEKTIEHTTLDEWNQSFAVNATGTFLTSKYALPLLRNAAVAGTSASVINFGSYDGFIADPGLAAYCATKGAVHALTRAMACDHGPEGIRVNAICPGYIDTPMLQSFFKGEGSGGDGGTIESLQQAVRDVHPMRTYGTPEDIANLVNWLASDEARYASGQLWVLDGGLSAQVQQMRL